MKNMNVSKGYAIVKLPHFENPSSLFLLLYALFWCHAHSKIIWSLLKDCGLASRPSHFRHFWMLVVSSLVDILFIIYTLGAFQIPRPEIKPFYLAAVFLLSSPLSIPLSSKWFCIMSYSWPLHVHLVEHVLWIHCEVYFTHFTDGEFYLCVTQSI